MVRPQVRNFRILLGVLVLLTTQAFSRASGQSPEAAGLKFKVVPTVFYAEVSGGLKQLIDVEVENAGPEVQADLEVALGAAKQTFRLGRLVSGSGKYPIYLAEVKVPVAIKLTLKAGAATVEKDFTLIPPAQVDRLSLSPLPYGHRLHRAPDPGGGEPPGLPRFGHRLLPGHGGLSRRREVPLEHRSELGPSELPGLRAPKARSGNSSTSSGRGGSSFPGSSFSFPTVSPTRSSSARSILPMRWGAGSISRSRRR